MCCRAREPGKVMYVTIWKNHGCYGNNHLVRCHGKNDVFRYHGYSHVFRNHGNNQVLCCQCDTHCDKFYNLTGNVFSHSCQLSNRTFVFQF